MPQFWASLSKNDIFVKISRQVRINYCAVLLVLDKLLSDFADWNVLLEKNAHGKDGNVGDENENEHEP